MIEIKTLGGGLNLDDSQYRLPPNDYIDALNITHDAVEGSNDQVITPIIANRIGDADFVYPDGINKCIGAYANTLRNTIIQMIWNSNDYHLVLEYNLTTRTQTKIFANLTDSADVDILGFTQEGKILSINIYNRDEGDLLFFLDSLDRPTEMDIALFKAGEYTPVTRAVIDFAKKPPLSPPAVIYDNDTTRRSNNFRNLLTRYKYRFIYDDFTKSSWGSISIVPLPVSILSDIYTNIITNNNVIRMIVNTGDKNVRSVEVAFSFVEKTNVWSKFQSIIVLNKSELGLKQTTNIIRGTAGSDLAVTLFSGSVVADTIVNVYLTQLPSLEIVVGTYTVVTGDTLTDLAAGLAADMITKGVVLSPFSYNENLVYAWFNTIYAFSRVEIIAANPDNDNIDFPYAFYNDSTYPDIDVEESVELFYNVPRKANAQELLNGDTLAFIGITEGYNKNTIQNDIITVLTRPAGDTGGGTLFFAVAIGTDVPAGQQTIYTLNGIPATGTIIEIKIKQLSDHAVIVASTYTTVAGDTPISVATHLSANDTALHMTVGHLNNQVYVYCEKAYYEPIVGIYYSQMVITAPASATATNSIPTWPWLEERTLARGYFDEKGVTNGILYTSKVTFPPYAENGSQQPLLPYINAKVNDIPPIWAASVQWYVNKSDLNFIVWETFSVNKSETEFIYLEVTSFITNANKIPTTATVLSYTFKDGDRVRVWRDTSNVVYNDTYDALIVGLVSDPIINFVPQPNKQFLKIRNSEPFTTGLPADRNYVIDIYTPTQQAANQSTQIFVEFGQQYNILDAGLSTRRHAGMVTDQIPGSVPAEYNFYDGDVYFRSRTIAVGDIGYAIFNVIDPNFLDIYPSAVSSVDGRPSIIDINAREAYYSTLIRHGEAYQANTNINGLNEFFAKNFDEYPINHGDVLRIIMKDKQLIVMHKFKIGHVTLFSSIGKDPNGLTVVFNTDKLLNPIQYYVGDFGIGTCPESVASFNYAIYGCDNIKGIIWRLSNDGLIAISQKYKMNSWANDNLNQGITNQKVYGAFDQRLDNYLIALSTDDTVCVPVSVPTITLPDGIVGEYYRYTVRITGTEGFEFTNVVEPDWMTISESGKVITFEGMPTEEGTDLTVSFTITNPCGTADIGPLTFNITEMTTGTIDMWGGDPTLVPSGWLICDGSAISRVTFADLFAVTGVLYGPGNGTTTFNLPNIKQRVVAGYDSGAAGYNTVGGTGGTGTATLTDQQISHKHTYDKYTSTGGGIDGDNGPTDFSYVLTDTSSIGNAAIARDPVDTRDKYIVLSFKIKT